MLKNFYLLNISYDGSRYHGFQIQKNSQTIQGVFSYIFKNKFNCEKLRIYCSSRTDAKVHALDQYLLLNSTMKYNDEFLSNLKSYLPDDIQIKRGFVPPKGFDIIAGSEYKEYHYLFSNIDTELNSNYFTNILEPLDIALMNKACKLFIGNNNFYNFQYKGNQKNFNRTIFDCSISKTSETYFESKYPEDLYLFKIRGKGFMRHMVRIIMGSLINLGSGQIKLEDIEKSFTPKEKWSGFIAPAQGLYQYKTKFNILEGYSDMYS